MTADADPAATQAVLKDTGPDIEVTHPPEIGR